jgi:hypothetical protein
LFVCLLDATQRRGAHLLVGIATERLFCLKREGAPAVADPGTTAWELLGTSHVGRLVEVGGCEFKLII